MDCFTLCDNIRFCGPVWATWTFWMERYCGYLQAALRSKVSPWADLNNRILHKAYLDQIDIFYDLNPGNSQADQLSRGEHIFATCKSVILNSIQVDCLTELWTDPNSILRPPSIRKFPLDDSLLKKIAGYFHVVIGQRTSDIKKRLPPVMRQWGKVRIGNGGDSIRCKYASLPQKKERNMSFVRVIAFFFCCLRRELMKFFVLVRDRSGRCRPRKVQGDLLWKPGYDFGIQRARGSILGRHTGTNEAFGSYHSMRYKWS
jgi:hypothetical protein